MSQLSQLLKAENILLDIDVTSKKRALEQAALMFENNQGIARHVVFDAFFSRERLGSTALGNGVAVPHGRLSQLRKATVGILRLKRGVLYDAPDGSLVQLLICLLVPEHEAQKHLEILAEIARILSNEQVREHLFKETDPQTIIRLMNSEISGGS